jgi:hypothetical protein
VGGTGADVHRRGDNRQNALSIRQNIVIPKSQDSVAIRAQERVSRSITRRLWSMPMLAAIQFNHQSVRVAREVYEVRPDCCLPAEVRPTLWPLPKSLP